MGQTVQNPKNILRNLEFILKQWEVINSYKQLQERNERERFVYLF